MRTYLFIQAAVLVEWVWRQQHGGFTKGGENENRERGEEEADNKKTTSVDKRRLEWSLFHIRFIWNCIIVNICAHSSTIDAM